MPFFFHRGTRQPVPKRSVPPGAKHGEFFTQFSSPGVDNRKCGVKEVAMMFSPKMLLRSIFLLPLIAALITGSGHLCSADEIFHPLPAETLSSGTGLDNRKETEKKEKEWVKHTLSLRARYESINNYDFNDSIDDNKSFTAQRWRLKSESTGDLHALMELRFIRASIAALNTVELSQLYLDIGKDVIVRPGRQEVLYGDGRIVWNPDWSNEGIFFQGVRSMWKASPSLQIDGLYLQPLVYPEQPVMGDELLYGMYSTWKPGKNSDLQLYYLSNLRKNKGLGKRDMELNIPGVRYAFSCGSKLTGSFEGALQTGRNGTNEQNAYAYFMKVKQKIGMPWEPSIGVKYDCASGDSNPKDSVYDGFEIMYNTKHGIFGNMDMIGQKNVRDFAATFTLKPFKQTELLLSHHWLRLDSPTDAWYGPRGNVFMKDPSGKWGTDMGTEMDYEIRYDTHRWNIWAGYGMLTPGECVKQLKKRANAAEKTYLLVQYKWDF
jgi:hypothetical protein